MSVILALETTSDVCSVALGTADDHVLDSQTAPRQHNQLTLPMIDAACKSLGIDRQVIECVAFSAGPGSFTGVRFGAALAQGIATGTDASIYRVPTSLAMGERVCRTIGVEGEFIGRRLSRRDLVYEARLTYDGRECAFVSNDRLVTLNKDTPDVAVFADSSVPLSAEDVLLMAARNLSRWEPPAAALPIYVEGDHPWRPAS